ncbi:hypothetical protein [Agaricicola taiwanensis]|nr:hypothetical protein [Agaricicola taiwanensis]
MGLFSLGRRRDEAAEQARAHVSALVRQHLSLGEHDAVTVSEIACGDPGCGGAETVVLILRAGRRTEAVKVKKALFLATDEEILLALETIQAA